LTEDEENDSVRFHLPMHIGARYGQAPTLFSHHSHAFLEILAFVETVSPIAKIGSPSHTIVTEFGPDPSIPSAHDLPRENYARVSLSSQSALERDFVLTIKSTGLDAPRCIAELHPTEPTTAIALTLVPRFQLPGDVPAQEYIFLVDRSGSMSHARIITAKKALVVLLRALPSRNTSTYFQIVSFGSHATMLWNAGSRPYDQGSLDEATMHVDGMKADYGGTEIRAALEMCFVGRRKDVPTSVFVLTDGDAWDIKGVLSSCKDAVSASPAEKALRLFVLGIGDSASTAMCEGIARVGNGTCMMVGETESATGFTGKIARMLKAARTPLLSDVEVDWGVPIRTEDEDDFVMVPEVEKKSGETNTIQMFDASNAASLELDINTPPSHVPVVLPPPPQIQQSPFKIQHISPGNRVTVYVIIQGSSPLFLSDRKVVPKSITFSGTIQQTKVQLQLPVTLSNLPNSPEAAPAIHALAAKKIVQDLEDGEYGVVKVAVKEDDVARRAINPWIVRLGTTYSISTSQTSFVVVDESGSVLQHS
ncbi:hypothetical protein C8F01DRAFT_926916, partial [Mycena amicta]